MASNFYNYLADTTNTKPYLLKNDMEVWFEITEEYGFIISFKVPVRVYEEEEDEDFELDFEEERERRFMSPNELILLPSLSDANYVQLYTTEIYGYRDSISTENFKPQSIAKTMYALLRKLHVLDKDIVNNYMLHTNEGFEDWGSMCSVGEYFNYLFLINLKCSEDQLIKVVDLLKQVNNSVPIVSPYVAKDYVALYKFSDSKQVSILNTNTKTRRLGYLKLLGKYFLKYPQSPYSQFYKRYESFVIPYQDQLLESINPKGVVSTNKKGVFNGNSVKPYAELADSLGYINKLNKVATVSKHFKVYVELLKQNDTKSRNPFLLELTDKFFLGESILKHDFLYISILLEIIYIKNSTSFIELRNIYRDCLITRLKYFQQENYYYRDKKAIDNIKKIEARINNWEKPERYLEHVLMPRLNWLADLGFVELSKTKNREVFVDLTPKGNKFFECISDWYDLKFDWIINPEDFMTHYFPHIFATTYDVSQKHNLTFEELKAFVLNQINDCFDIFKTMAINRITLSQTISYIQYKALAEIGLSISQKYLDGIIQNDLKDSFIYKFQTQFNDGYLQKIKN